MKSSHHDLSEQYRVSNNAYVSFYFLTHDCTLNYQHRYKAYIKSRPPASRISFLRAKDLDTMSVHPLSVNETTKGETMTLLSSYRPKSTIIEISSMKSGSQVMKEKK